MKDNEQIFNSIHFEWCKSSIFQCLYLELDGCQCKRFTKKNKIEEK